MTRRYSTVIFCAAMAMSCSSPPKEHFYVLRLGDTTQGAVSEEKDSVEIGPVTLPEIVDRPQIVLNTRENGVEISELHRWGEPLKQAIPRVIAFYVSQELSDRVVTVYPQSVLSDVSIRVLVDVQRFETAPDQNEVILEALWSVRRSVNGDVKLRHSLIREAAVSEGYDALVSAHGRALARMSQEIADAVRSLED